MTRIQFSLLWASAWAVLMAPGRAAAFDTVKFLDPIPLKGAAGPESLAVGDDRIYVVDRVKDALLILDGQGRLLKSVGSKGEGREQFRGPEAVAVGPDGRVFVADTGNSRVQLLDREGRFLWSFGSGGSDAGSLSGPKGVSVGTDGRVYVADTGDHRVKVFTKEGIFLYGFGSKGDEQGRFKSPEKVAVDLADNVYVLDGGNERIQKFDPATRFLKEFALNGGDFALDEYGFIYVLESDKAKVHEFDSKGAFLGKFGSAGKGSSQFNLPKSVALTPDGGVVLVLDAGNGRIQRVEVPNKLKTQKLSSNPAAKLLVTGPAASWPYKVDAIRAWEDQAYAYDPQAGQFVVLDKEGKERLRFGTKKGKGPAVTKGTRGFAVSRKLGIYVSDTPGNRIQKFDLEGNWRSNYAEKEGFFDSRKNEGRVRSPRGIAVNEEGTFYVADADNRRVDVFSPDGSFLSAIGPQVDQYELREPHDVAWDPEGFIFVVDKGLKRVLKCGPSGNLVASWGGEGDGVGQFQSPEAVAYDGKNYVYVLDGSLRRVSVFTKDGRWMTDLFSGGKGERELSDPVGLALQGPRLLVADKGKEAIKVFDMHPYLVAPVSISTAAKGGTVTLAWKPVADPWALRYVVRRAASPAGPWEQVGVAQTEGFEDSTVAAAQTYWYSLATESRTGDLGAASSPVPVFVPASANRSPVEISTVAIGNIFSANYKWYLKNPVGLVTVTNNVNVPFQNVKLTFRLKDFMDFGYDKEIKRLGPRETVEVPLIATLNNKILEVTEDTPIQAEFELTFFEEGQQRGVSRTEPLRVYSRNAITWDDSNKIGTFITPKDPPILGFSREVIRTARESAVSERLNHALATAARLWAALSEAGIKFITNPNNPFEERSEDPSFPVDYTQFPRETLKLKSGQCDDLSTLIASMLESARVRTALIDYPGHMALMFDTEEADPVDAGLPADDMILYEGTYWVPVEATMVGRPFGEAVRKALYAYKTESAKGAVKVIDLRKAWQTYEPATLPTADWTSEVPPADVWHKRADPDLAAWAKDRYSFLKKHYEEVLRDFPDDLDSLNELGVLEHEAGDKDAARKRFGQVLAVDPANAAAWNNTGTLEFLSGDYAAAEAGYLKATGSDPADPDLWLNLMRCAVKLKDAGKARRYADKAVSLDPGFGPVVETWLK
ncbi:MAG: tetratricopeptide repeat protein [Elusimicrobia bacterium]|nr:tetratricopeptide repeat protein [Elusimicrobiota bacterium]